MDDLRHLWEDKEGFDGCQVGIRGSVAPAPGSREAEREMIYNPVGSLYTIVWHQLGLL